MIDGSSSVARSQSKFGKRPGPTGPGPIAWHGSSPWRGDATGESAEMEVPQKWMIRKVKSSENGCFRGTPIYGNPQLGLRPVEKTGGGSRSWTHAAMCPMFGEKESLQFTNVSLLSWWFDSQPWWFESPCLMRWIPWWNPHWLDPCAS